MELKNTGFLEISLTDTSTCQNTLFYPVKLFVQVVNSYPGRGKGFVNLPFGKNMVNELSHEIAKILGKPNQSDFTFHSFRRSSAVASIDTGTSGLLCHGTGKAGRSNSLDTDIKLEADPLQIESSI